MLLFRLGEVFRRPVADLDLDIDEFVHWMAYSRLQPFSDSRNEYMLAQLTALVAQLFSKSKVKPSDFMLSAQMEKAEQKASSAVMSFEDQARAAFGVPKRGSKN